MEEKTKTTATEKVIEIKGLVKSFGTYQVLKGVDLDLYKGENLVVLGKSGTGKSVLIKIVVGLLTPDQGRVSVLNQLVDEISYKELLALRLKVGFSFQNSALYDSMTIRENLEFPLVRNQKQLSKGEVNKLSKKC
jgi:phospholipid/cholesterol/gamma-HCH transport system ATP-binding protein